MQHVEASDQLRSSCRVPRALAQCSRVLRGSMAQLGRQGTEALEAYGAEAVGSWVFGETFDLS